MSAIQPDLLKGIAEMSDQGKSQTTLGKVQGMQANAAANGNHGYSSVLAEAAREIILLRRLLIEARSTRAADIVADGWADRVDAAIGDQPHAE